MVSSKPRRDAADASPARKAFPDPLEWPRSAWLFLAGVGLLYAPLLAGAVHQWISNDNYAHGFFVFPLAALTVWLRRDAIRAAPRRPTAWGFVPLALGLAMEAAGGLLQIKYIGMWSLIPTLAGGILLLHGPRLWAATQFSVWFLLFAAPLPNVWLGHVTGTIQAVSTVGASSLMSLLGFPVLRQGNVLSVPGATLEVANACSGFHKMVSLLAFAALYGYLSTSSPLKRLLLLLAALPVALLANVLRISSLIGAAAGGGLPLLHVFHDPAEVAAIGIAFCLFIAIGKGLGCNAIALTSTPAPSPSLAA